MNGLAATPALSVNRLGADGSSYLPTGSVKLDGAGADFVAPGGARFPALPLPVAIGDWDVLLGAVKAELIERLVHAVPAANPEFHRIGSVGREPGPARRVKDVLTPSEGGDREEEQGRSNRRESPPDEWDREQQEAEVGQRRARRDDAGIRHPHGVEHDGHERDDCRRQYGEREVERGDRPHSRCLQADVAAGASPTDNRWHGDREKRPGHHRGAGGTRRGGHRRARPREERDDPGHNGRDDRSAPDLQVEAHGRTVRSGSTSSQVVTSAAA